MILNNKDLFSTVSDLVKVLREAGEDDLSSELTQAVYISTVPGEVLGEIRCQLAKLRATTVATSLGILPKIDEALSYTNRVLNSTY